MIEEVLENCELLLCSRTPRPRSVEMIDSDDYLPESQHQEKSYNIDYFPMPMSSKVPEDGEDPLYHLLDGEFSRNIDKGQVKKC